jgi:hypothetical protein
MCMYTYEYRLFLCPVFTLQSPLQYRCSVVLLIVKHSLVHFVYFDTNIFHTKFEEKKIASINSLKSVILLFLIVSHYGVYIFINRH